MYTFDPEKISMSLKGLKENEFPSLLYVKNVTANVSKISKRAKYDRVVLTIVPDRLMKHKQEEEEAFKKGEIPEVQENNTEEYIPKKITGAEDPSKFKKPAPKKKARGLKPYQKLIYYDYPFKVEGCINTIVSSTQSKTVGNIESKYINDAIKFNKASSSGALYFNLQ